MFFAWGEEMKVGGLELRSGASHHDRPKLLAVASGGGHWEQMLVISQAFSSFEVIYLTTDDKLIKYANINRGYVVKDCNRNTPVTSLLTLLKVIRIVFLERPSFIVSTGALPGLLCLAAGKVSGSKTIWVDSVANGERLSMCGKVAARFASLCLTQWEHLAHNGRPSYFGSVL